MKIGQALKIGKQMRTWNRFTWVRNGDFGFLRIRCLDDVVFRERRGQDAPNAVRIQLERTSNLLDQLARFTDNTCMASTQYLKKYILKYL